MRITRTDFAGLLLVEPERHSDERGHFARTWCAQEFAATGVVEPIVQTSVSWNARRGTLRGMHYQRSPSREGKLVRCSRGRVFDVAIDLRKGEPTYCRHHGIQLDHGSGRAVYIPPGMAHGFVTLEDDTEIHYSMTDFYAPEFASGVRWNDPAFAIPWPVSSPFVNERDAAYPDFVD